MGKRKVDVSTCPQRGCAFEPGTETVAVTEIEREGKWYKVAQKSCPVCNNPIGEPDISEVQTEPTAPASDPNTALDTHLAPDPNAEPAKDSAVVDPQAPVPEAKSVPEPDPEHSGD